MKVVGNLAWWSKRHMPKGKRRSERVAGIRI
jgi:hypothetical protein